MTNASLQHYEAVTTFLATSERLSRLTDEQRRTLSIVIADVKEVERALTEAIVSGRFAALPATYDQRAANMRGDPSSSSVAAGSGAGSAAEGDGSVAGSHIPNHGGSSGGAEISSSDHPPLAATAQPSGRKYRSSIGAALSGKLRVGRPATTSSPAAAAASPVGSGSHTHHHHHGDGPASLVGKGGTGGGALLGTSTLLSIMAGGGGGGQKGGANSPSSPATSGSPSSHSSSSLLGGGQSDESGKGSSPAIEVFEPKDYLPLAASTAIAGLSSRHTEQINQLEKILDASGRRRLVLGAVVDGSTGGGGRVERTEADSNAAFLQLLQSHCAMLRHQTVLLRVCATTASSSLPPSAPYSVRQSSTSFRFFIAALHSGVYTYANHSFLIEIAPCIQEGFDASIREADRAVGNALQSLLLPSLSSSSSPLLSSQTVTSAAAPAAARRDAWDGIGASVILPPMTNEMYSFPSGEGSSLAHHSLTSSSSSSLTSPSSSSDELSGFDIYGTTLVLGILSSLAMGARRGSGGGGGGDGLVVIRTCFVKKCSSLWGLSQCQKTFHFSQLTAVNGPN